MMEQDEHLFHLIYEVLHNDANNVLFMQADLGPLILLSPVAHNHTEKESKSKDSHLSPVSVQGVVAQRKVEDLERELKRRMRVLEEERKALRKKTQKHQQYIDHGLEAVHQRISSLEQGEFVHRK